VQQLLRHIKTHILKGMLAAVPLALMAFSVSFLYPFIDRRVMGLFDQILGFSVPGLRFVLLFAALYGLGLAASHVLGKRFSGLLEGLTGRVPLLSTTYKIDKQLATTPALPERQIFKQAVFPFQ
jgi:uncharacterized membrane protein